MQNRRFFVSIIALLLLALSSRASAALWTLQANLDGLQEVPPNASPAFGQFDVTLDDSTNVFTVVTGTYQDLLGGSTAVTLNDAAIGTNGPIALTLTLDTPGAATGTVSGNGGITGAQATDMLAGNTYVNIRSQVFPSGEIRGQLFVVPEPASLSLALLGGTLLLRRRAR